MRKIIANRTSIIPAGWSGGWQFPFSKDNVPRIKIEVSPGLIKWIVPEDVAAQIPEVNKFTYTNVFGKFLIISFDETDLCSLHRVLYKQDSRLERVIYPNTDSTETIKKTYKRKPPELIMKVTDGNLALKDHMESFFYTTKEKVAPEIWLGRYLAIRGQL